MSSAIRTLATLRVGNTNVGGFDVFSGGKVTASSLKHRFGGEIYTRAIGSPPDVEDLTINRVYVNARDQPYKPLLRGAVGKTDYCTVTVADLDDDQQPYGKGDTYLCTMTGFTPPEGDSDGTDDLRRMEIELAVSGPVS